MFVELPEWLEISKGRCLDNVLSKVLGLISFVMKIVQGGESNKVVDD